VEVVQQQQSGACLGPFRRCGVESGAKKLEAKIVVSVGFAATEVDVRAVNTVPMENEEVVGSGEWDGAGTAVGMTELQTQSESFEGRPAEERARPFLEEISTTMWPRCMRTWTQWNGDVECEARTHSLHSRPASWQSVQRKVAGREGSLQRVQLVEST
jgi:hypothetical protein